MPIREYVCKDCGHKFEVIQSYGEKQLTICPKCEKDSLELQFSTGTSFRGCKGFAAIDSRKGTA
jgi:putative FmdB family regulatory protein